MKRNILLLMLLLATLIVSNTAIAQTNNESGRFTIINEYGPFFGRATIGFTGVFVLGYTFPNQKELFGLGVGYEAGTDIYTGIPIFLNFRHTFNPEKRFTPLVNVGLGLRYCMNYSDQLMGYYATISSGFQSGLFSFTGGLYFKSFGVERFYSGIEIKCGYKL